MNRRKVERFDLQVPVQVALRKPLAGTTPKMVLQTRDISSQGAFLYSYQPFAKGTRMNIDVYLSYEKLRRIFGADRFLVVSLHGKVIRVEEDGLAVRFERRYRMRPA